jgi:hypothetical protein
LLIAENDEEDGVASCKSHHLGQSKCSE